MTKDRRREKPEKRVPKPLDAAALERLALHYVGRFATTRGRLSDYLRRKLRERGWAESTEPGGAAMPDLDALAQRLADLGYIDDRGFADARAASMQRRGLGARRVAGAFHADGIDASDAEAVAPAIADRGVDAALAYARRKRVGPFGNPEAAGDAGRALRQKQLAAMMRAGHGFELSRKILSAPASDAFDPADFE